MAIKDILLPLLSYPSATAPEAIDKCAVIGARLKARVTVAALELDILPAPGPFAGAFVLDAPDSAAPQEIQISRKNAEQALQRFESAAQASDLASEALLMRATAEDAAAQLVQQARLKDLTLLPIKPHDGRQEALIENFIFNSGRPVLVFDEQSSRQLSDSFDHVSIAWDHSAQAARAVADALPLLKAAKSVRIFTMVDDPAKAQSSSPEGLAKHLAVHGVETSVELVKANPDGNALKAYVNSHQTELLVMGAYRHSRLREFIMGGATYAVLGHPPCWVMMSH
jgi:nucleotide-binding universal stress UspA family protein